MSLSTCLNDKKSSVTAIAESNSTIMLLPSDKVKKWINNSPAFNNIFYELYNTGYSDMINTLNQVLFENIEDRLLKYLHETKRIKQNSELKLKHREIADDLGTAREVISRMLKKLEKDKRIHQEKNGIIKIL
jgi:CRP/FNR family transcriptional regulator